MTNQEAIVVIKKDAIEDGVSEQVIDFIGNDPRIEIQNTSSLELTTDEILAIYAPELLQDPSERREILMVMGAQAMTGANLFMGVHVLDASTQEEGFGYLNALKGSIRDTEAAGTVRGSFPYPRPAAYDSYSFWFQAPFFVRNRVHIPDSHDALSAVESIALQHGISPEELYGRK